MPRSSFSDNPLLRVSRPVSACSRCRAAKVKCDGKLPACTACEKAGRESECSSANDQFARGKERSYVAALELRIEKLERRLAFARSRKASVNLHADEAPAQYDRKDSLAKIRAAIYRKAARKREDSDINSLVSDFGFLSVDATSRDFEPALNNMTFGLFVLAASTNDDMPEGSDAGLPPRPEAHVIVQYYMANIYSLLPCFSETKLLTVLDDIYQQDNRVIQEADRWLVYMVLATGYVAQSHSRDDVSYRKALDFVARALPYADGALAPGYVTQIQSLILLTQYSMLDPAHFNSWYLIGFASRAVIDMGFHQDPLQSQVNDAAVLDMRRRIFYCVYSLDRSISMAHARPFSFTDDCINVSYPNATGRRDSVRQPSMIQSPLNGPQDADPALFLFELRHKQSNWYQTLFQSEPTPLNDASSFIWQSCLEMREWNESLPNTLPTPIRELFDLELHYSYVYCLSPCARAPTMTVYTRALIFEHAIIYMNAIHGVAQHGSPITNAFYTYHDVLKVYFMATQFVNALNDGADALLHEEPPQTPPGRPGAAPPPPIPRRQAPAEDNVARSLRCLQQVDETLEKYGERWENALPLRESFEALSADLWSWLKLRQQMMKQQQQQQAHQRYHMQPPPPAPPSGSSGMPPQMQMQGGMRQAPPGVQQYQWV